ncbi:MAG: hypothetical protein K0S66_3031 [Sphingomonas sp.]|jgi:hypothetical protein|nr:hypothetical protein [Sphingomonas sp.]
MILPSKHIRNVRFQAVGTWTCMTEIKAHIGRKARDEQVCSCGRVVEGDPLPITLSLHTRLQPSLGAVGR